MTDRFPRTWVEFDDPADARRRFRCDLTWLTSNWRCVYGAGCRSIDADVPYGGCCVLGAHFADDADLNRVAAQVEQLDEELWDRHPGSTASPAWTTTTDGVTMTRVVDGACIFLNRPDSPTGAGCALHHLAARTGASHVEVMPNACWQLPLRRADRYVDYPDGTRQVEVTLTEYTRRDWGPGWREIDWYCTDSAEAHIDKEPVYRSCREELVALMGEPACDVLAQHAATHLAAVRALRSGGRTHLPLLVHPATLEASERRATPPKTRRR